MLSELKAVRMSWDAPAFWMYSSGTTGKPKGGPSTKNDFSRALTEMWRLGQGLIWNV